MSLTVITDERLLEHDTGGGLHPEVPARLTVLLDRLQHGPLAERLDFAPPRSAERQWLGTVHDEAYLLRFEEVALSGRQYLDHPDNQLCYETFAVALLAAGAGLEAIDRLEAGRAGHVFCCVRPPGHHAERAAALGFCFLNNVAIAARYWQQMYARERVLIVDFDAHHGNGIQAAFEEEAEVFYVSLHEHPTFSFPGTGYAEETGLGAGHGATLNLPLPPGADDAAAINAFDRRVAPAIERFAPQAIIVAAGFDGHRLDDMSGLAYSTDCYRKLGIRLASLAGRYCAGRLLSVLEGGYHLESLAAGAASYLAGFAGEPS